MDTRKKKGKKIENFSWKPIKYTCGMCGEEMPFEYHSLQICEKCADAWRVLVLRERKILK